MSEIYPKQLFLGNIVVSRDEGFFKKNKIKNVLIAGKGLKRTFSSVVNYCQLDISDNPTTIILKHWPESIRFLDESIQTKAPVLVHCQGGKSRSASTVMAYVMFKESLSAVDAVAKVRKLHKFAYPNPGFLKQLEYWEDILNEYRKTIKLGNAQEDYALLQRLTSIKLSEVTKAIVDPWNNNTYNDHLSREQISKYGKTNDKMEDGGDGDDEEDNDERDDDQKNIKKMHGLEEGKGNQIEDDSKEKCIKAKESDQKSKQIRAHADQEEEEEQKQEEQEKK